jgi:hypothetical protein
MDDIQAIVSEKSAWPMIHVFVPAIVAIYAQNIWVLLSIIYLFESVEFCVSLMPGLEYWGDVGANALISDIIMGLVGAWLVRIIGDVQYSEKSHPWYAILSDRPCCCRCYKHFQPYLHTVLAAGSSGFASISIMMDIIPEDTPQEFIYFGISYLFFALLFGKDRFCFSATLLVIIISVISIFAGHTGPVSFAVVFAYFLLDVLYRKLYLTPPKGYVNVPAEAGAGILLF